MLNYFFPFIFLFITRTWADNPTYLSINQCPPLTQELIANKNLNIKLIHSCHVLEENIFSTHQKIKVVNINYGPADDCIAGCIYKELTAIYDTENGKRIFRQVPSKGSQLNLSEFPKFSENSNRKDFICIPKDLQLAVNKSYGKKNNEWGLFIELQKPLTCTWIQTTSTKFLKNYSHSLNEGIKIKSEWKGHIFFTANSIIPEIQFVESKLESLKWEENH